MSANTTTGDDGLEADDELDVDGYVIDCGADTSDGDLLIMVRCPVCDEQLIDDLDGTPDHDIVADHVATHSPADLDLDGTYRFKPMADILCELHGLD